MSPAPGFLEKAAQKGSFFPALPLPRAFSSPGKRKPRKEKREFLRLFPFSRREPCEEEAGRSPVPPSQAGTSPGAERPFFPKKRSGRGGGEVKRQGDNFSSSGKGERSRGRFFPLFSCTDTERGNPPPGKTAAGRKGRVSKSPASRGLLEIMNIKGHRREEE